MTCSDFVAHFSEYRDGLAREEQLRQAEEHLASCPSCRRYREVVDRGAQLLRKLPGPEIAEDFRPRLQHRLYHVDAESVLGGRASSAASGLAVVGMALVFTVVAWAPTLRSGAPEIELPAIEVSRPPLALRYRSAPAYPFNAGAEHRSARPSSVRPAGLWDDPPALLLEYSPLAHRNRVETSPSRPLERRWKRRS